MRRAPLASASAAALIATVILVTDLVGVPLGATLIGGLAPSAALADEGKPGGKDEPEKDDPAKGEPKKEPSPIGVGGGASGPYGRRLGAKRGLVGAGGGSAATEAAVLAGQRWLARHQGEDGGWHTEGLSSACAGDRPCTSHSYGQFDIGQTGVALLALLGAGVAPTRASPAGATPTATDTYEDPLTRKEISPRAVVRRGLDYLRSTQDDEGCYGARAGEFMYNHAIAALAMAEAAGLSGAEEDRASAQKAIDFIALAQNPYAGWRYAVKPGDNDTSVTGWCVMAAKAAEGAKLKVPAECYRGAKAWIDSATDRTGVIGYNGLGKVDVVVRGKNEEWGPHQTMTAIGLACKLAIDGRGERQLETHADVLAGDLPRWEGEDKAQGRVIDFYYWYQGSLAIFQLDGPAGPRWKKWNEAMKTALVGHQKVKKDGCADGSWDPEACRWGFAGGRVYATAMNVLTLETYYRVAPAKGTPPKKK